MRDAVSNNILNEISGILGADTASQIKQILAKSGQTKSTILVTVIEILILISGVLL